MKNKIYLFDHSKRTKEGGFPVYIGKEDEKGEPIELKELSPKRSQKLDNGSPDGFNWGYYGSGPRQCALGLLLDVTNDKDKSLRWYLHFTQEVLAHMPIDKKLQIPEEKIIEWINDKENNYKEE